MRRFLLLLVLSTFVIGIRAQDIHFTQFYASPLTLNPAMTGAFDGSYRIAGIYRNQWSSVMAPVPFHTPSVSFDIKLLENKMKTNVLAVGLAVTGDRSGDGNLSMMDIKASASYHKSLGEKMMLGLGLQAGYTSKSLDYNKLRFPNQFSGTDFDISLPTFENFGGKNPAYMDFNAGLLFGYKPSERINTFAGYSLFHISQPKESFLSQANAIGARHTAHAGADIALNEKMGLSPNIIYQTQSKASEFNLGTALTYKLKFGSKDAKAGLGVWYRLKDALAFVPSLEWNNLRLGIAYDVNLSQLRPASNGRGAFEISLIYIGKMNNVVVPKSYHYPCPVM